MKKLLLLALFAGVTTGTVPELRERAVPVVRPVADAALGTADAAVALFANSIFRWSVQRELHAIAGRIADHLAAGDPLPSPERFPRFLQRNRMGGSIDPWGGPYFLQLTRDSIYIGSTGPDTTPGTPDDLRAGLSRARP